MKIACVVWGEKHHKTVQKHKIVSCKLGNSFVEFLVAANRTLHCKMSRLRTDHVTIITSKMPVIIEGRA